MTPKQSKITDTTWVPLGLAIIVIGGGATWVATMSWKSYDHEKRIGNVELTQVETLKGIANISLQLDRLERGGRDGIRHKNESDSGNNLSRPEEEDDSNLSRRIRESRISDESDFGVQVDRRTEKDLVSGS